MDSSPQNYVCRSEVLSKPFTFRWQIDRFPIRLMKIDDEYNSPRFKVGDKVPVFVGLHRRKDDSDGDEKLSVYLANASKEKRLKMDFSITLVNSQSKKSITGRAHEARLFETITNKSLNNWGWRNFALFASVLDKTGGFLKDGHRLTLLITGTVFVEKPSDAVKSEDLDLLNYASSCNEDFGKLFDGGEHSDFLGKVKDADGKERGFKVHRNILAARSKFFEAMFSQSEVKECREGQMLVEDIDSAVMESLIRFLYTGKTPQFGASESDGNEHAFGLLVAADKYGIMGLKNRLERVLTSKLSVENVCEILILAERHSAPFLAARCRDFIQKRSRDVVQTDGWSELCALGDAKLIGSLIVNTGGDGKVIQNPEKKSDGNENTKKKSSKRFFFF